MKWPLFFLLVIVGGCRQTPAIVFPEGGYPYPGKISAYDSTYYFYPVRDLFSRGDSLLYAISNSFYGAFGESNLSLGPQPEPVFRFVYSPALSVSTIIVLKENEIVVKKYTSGWQVLDGDESRLAPPEKARYILLRQYYPLYAKPYANALKKHIDSMVNDFPRLTDPAYYKYLIEKAFPFDGKPFVYSTRRIALTPDQYEHLVTTINGSGYWKLPLALPCTNPPMDGVGYCLEANTPGKYNLVIFNGPCQDGLPFRKACQELVNYAGEKSIAVENE